MKSQILIAMVLLLGLTLAACTPGGGPSTTQTSPGKPAGAPAPELRTWEKQWEETVKAARKEGKLVFYSVTNPQTRAAVTSAFKEKYGIEVEWTMGAGGEISRKLLNEWQAGLKIADVFNSGFSILFLKQTGALQPLGPSLILPEVLDKNLWLGNKLPFVDKAEQVVAFLAGYSTYLLINTEMIREGQIKSYVDLLNPEWKGKILMYDPTLGGGSSEWVAMMMINVLGMDKGKEFMVKFKSQEPMIIRDTRLTAEWVARGKYPMVIGAYKQGVSEFLAAGAPLKYQKVAEGALISASGGMLGRINGGPNPNATTVFVNWLLSKEGQTLFSKTYGFPSARRDVPTEGLDPALLIPPGEKVIVPDEDWYVAKDKLLPVIKEAFGL